MIPVPYTYYMPGKPYRWECVLKRKMSSDQPGLIITLSLCKTSAWFLILYYFISKFVKQVPGS